MLTDCSSKWAAANEWPTAADGRVDEQDEKQRRMGPWRGDLSLTLDMCEV